jgi:hypothetical protein
MSHTVPTSEPTELRAGDSWQWDTVLDSYPPSEGWTLTYYFQGPAEVLPAEASTASAGDYYEVRELPAVSEAYTPGTYTWEARVSDGTDTHTVAIGVVRVVSNLEAAAPQKTHGERCLEAVEAALEGRVTADTQSFQINGRVTAQIPVKELLELRGHFRSEVWRERNPGLMGPQVGVRFGEPT